MPKITVAGGPSSALGQDAEPEPLPPPPPASALKAEHVEYAAEALGIPAEEAESMTKPELVDLAKRAVPRLSGDG